MAEEVKVFHLDVCNGEGVVERLSVQGDRSYCRKAGLELARKTIAAQHREGVTRLDWKVVIRDGDHDIETIPFWLVLNQP